MPPPTQTIAAMLNEFDEQAADLTRQLLGFARCQREFAQLAKLVMKQLRAVVAFGGTAAQRIGLVTAVAPRLPRLPRLQRRYFLNGPVLTAPNPAY